jgi:hypothetical protein
MYAAGVVMSTVVIAAQYDLARVYLALQPVVVACAAVLAWAWREGRWLIAAATALLTIAAPWGYFYLGPLAALLLTGVAVRRGVDDRRTRAQRA